MTNFSKKIKKLFVSKTTVNPLRKKSQFFLTNNLNFPQVPLKFQNNIRIRVFHTEIVRNVFKIMLWTGLRASLKKKKEF